MFEKSLLPKPVLKANSQPIAVNYPAPARDDLNPEAFSSANQPEAVEGNPKASGRRTTEANETNQLIADFDKEQSELAGDGQIEPQATGQVVLKKLQDQAAKNKPGSPDILKIDLSRVSPETKEAPTILSSKLDCGQQTIIYLYNSQPAPIDDNWHDQAACQGSSPEFFYPDPERGEEGNIPSDFVRQVCGECLVRVDCLETALANETKNYSDCIDSFWAATSLSSRLAIKRRRRRHQTKQKRLQEYNQNVED